MCGTGSRAIVERGGFDALYVEFPFRDPVTLAENIQACHKSKGTRNDSTRVNTAHVSNISRALHLDTPGMEYVTRQLGMPRLTDSVAIVSSY